MLLLRVLCVSLVLAFPIATLAIPVSLEVFSGPELDTGHWGGGGGCGAREGCRAVGTLYADLDDGLMSNLHGDIFVRGIGAVSVTDGLFDFTSGGNSWLMTDQLGGFDIGAMGWNGDDGIRFVATSWDRQCNGWRCKRLRMRFRGHMDAAVPEPNAALLFGLGAIAVSRRVSRAH